MANKVKKVMGEFKEGMLHSGSKGGPVVKDEKQAIAIALSEQEKVSGKKKKKKKKKVKSTSDLREIYQEKYGKKSY